MSSFTEKLTVTKTNKRTWIVQRAFTYYIGSEDSDDSVIVPEGFHTDFASIPRILWSILPPDGEYTQAAVLHDYMYFSHIFSRKKSDKVFLEAMEVLGVPVWKRKVIYRAVRMFGGLFWKKT